MKKYLWFASAALGLISSSCYYDPSYGGSASYGVSSYGSGYSTSLFVSTGDPRWAYDPYRYSYYDRYSSRYYDPYLNGYYPVGYRPVVVRGCPHPYNWSGSGVCPPPRNVRSYNLTNCDNRAQYYRSANHAWSRNVSSSGSGSWMSSSERSNIQKQAVDRGYQGRSSSGSNWMGGSQRPSSGSTYQTPPPSRGGSSMFSQPRGGSSGWNGTSITPPSRTFVRDSRSAPQAQAPSIQPRPTSGGMFGGMDRSARQAPSIAPSSSGRSFDRTPTQREYSPPAPQSSNDDNDRGNRFDRDRGQSSGRFSR